MKGLRDQLLKKLRSHWKEGNYKYFNGQTIENWAMNNVINEKTGKPYKHATANRDLRLMEEAGEIEKTYEGNAQSVAYRYKPSKFETLHINMQEKLNA